MSDTKMMTRNELETALAKANRESGMMRDFPSYWGHGDDDRLADWIEALNSEDRAVLASIINEEN